jgi:hypothetical protein
MLTHLDNDFENGKIQEGVYCGLRTEGKLQFITLTQRTKEKSGNR